jgi:PTH1 family peptidyl-tRNA hydrolase
MNASGQAVRALSDYLHIATSSIVVVHDEADLPFGELRWKEGGGHAGHNGIRSMMEHLGGGDFARVRFGIGHSPHPEEPLDQFVLAPFTPNEQARLPDLIAQAGTIITEHIPSSL